MKRSASEIRKSRIRSVPLERDLEFPRKEAPNPPRPGGNLAIQPEIQLSMLVATLAPLQPEDMLDNIPDLIAETIVL